MDKFIPKNRERLTKWFFGLTIVLALIGLTMLIVQSTGAASVFSVTSSDMSPAVRKGSLVVTVPTPASEINKDDIIVISSQDNKESRVTRISSISADSSVYEYTVWADNATIPDEWLHKTKGSLDKVVFKVPVLGWLLIGLRFPLTLMVLFLGILVFSVHYTKNIYEYNGRKVRARRIAEERLEAMNHGGVDDIIELFEPLGGAVVVYGKEKKNKKRDIEKSMEEEPVEESTLTLENGEEGDLKNEA